MVGLLSKLDRMPQNMSVSGMNDRIQKGLEFYLLPNFVLEFILLVGVILILTGLRDKSYKSVLESRIQPARAK